MDTKDTTTTKAPPAKTGRVGRRGLLGIMGAFGAGFAAKKLSEPQSTLADDPNDVTMGQTKFNAVDAVTGLGVQANYTKTVVLNVAGANSTVTTAGIQGIGGNAGVGVKGVGGDVGGSGLWGVGGSSSVGAGGHGLLASGGDSTAPAGTGGHGVFATGGQATGVLSAAGDGVRGVGGTDLWALAWASAASGALQDPLASGAKGLGTGMGSPDEGADSAPASAA